MIGETNFNPEDSRGPKVNLDTSGRLPEEDTYATRPDSAEEVLLGQTRDHIDKEVELEAYREAKVWQMAQEIEKGRQTSQRAT